MSNAYAIFRRLLRTPPLLVGTVTAVDGGQVTIALPDGGVIQARGSASVDDQVFVRDGVVEGGAPALPVELIEI